MSLNWNVENVSNAWQTICSDQEAQNAHGCTMADLVANRGENAWQWDGFPNADGHSVTRMNPVTNRLVWLTMSIGIRYITEKNFEQFFHRVFIYEHAVGASRYDKDRNEKFFTLQEVHDNIGLRSNADERTEANFRKMIFENLMDGAERAADYEKEEIVGARMQS